MSDGFAFRPGTNDEAMFRHLTTHNEYEIPERFEPDQIVVDIGLHIGGFSFLALSRGARRVVGFEAEPGNAACARQNLARFGDRAEVIPKAVWRSDRPAGRLNLTLSDDAPNTGGNSVLWESPGPGVEAVALDDALLQITDGGRRRVNLLKIDCEGSEFPILLTARRLDLVDRIAGEFHEIGNARNPRVIPEHARVDGVPAFTVEALAAALERAGFTVRWRRHEDSFLGLFFAERAEPPRPAPARAGRLRNLWHAIAAKAPHFTRRARTGPSRAMIPRTHR
jgi:FkbM family methyltransferase